MVWTVEFSPEAAKDLRKLDRSIARRLLKFLAERGRRSVDARSFGEPLRGERPGAYWKYRVGDYRLIGRVEDKGMVVAVIQVGHRRDVYRD